LLIRVAEAVDGAEGGDDDLFGGKAGEEAGADFPVETEGAYERLEGFAEAAGVAVGDRVASRLVLGFGRGDLWGRCGVCE